METRKAKCTYFNTCRTETTSVPTLPFFESWGAGTKHSTICKCGYYKGAHDESLPKGCTGYEAKGANDHDQYYCGCKGWD